MRSRHKALAVLCALCWLGCGGRDRRREEAPTEVASEGPARAGGTVPYEGRDARPRLVLNVIIEGLGSEAFARLAPHLPERGFIHRVSREGTIHRRAEFPFSTTQRAPGIAALHTGATPRVSGVVAEEVSAGPGARRLAMTGEAGHITPTSMRAQAVADILYEATARSAKVISLAADASAAAIPAGHGVGLALFYDDRDGRFVTSPAYRDITPEWLDPWHARHSMHAAIGVWRPHDRGLLARVAGADEAPGEADWLGLGVTFPRELARTTDPLRALRATPVITRTLLSLATAAAREERLGVDDVPDLMTITIGATGEAGRLYGPHSWEYLDNLVVADLLLAELIDMLASRCPLSVILTSDHGMPSLPERETGWSRLDPEEFRRALDRGMDQRLGRRIPWIEQVVPPYIYMTGRTPLRVDEAITALIAELDTHPQVRRAYATADVAQDTEGGDALDALMRESAAEGRGGAVLFVPNEGVIMARPGADGGTNHGGPSDAERFVPVLMWGAGITQGTHEEVVDARRVASTLSALLGVPRAIDARLPPLPGARSTRR